MVEPHILFKQIESRPYSFLLDSATPPDKLSGRSFLGSDPFLVFKSRKDDIVIERPGRKAERFSADPFDTLKKLFKRYGDRAGGAAVGYFGYDMKDLIEDLPDIATDDLGMPDCILGFYDNIRSFPNTGGTAHTAARTMPFESAGDVTSNFSKRAYMKAVERAKAYIKKGDIYQVNLSQRFEAPLEMSPYELYLRLRLTSPAPFSSYLNFGDCAVISSSPERFLRKRGRYIETRPIKGTMPRSSDPLMDEFNATELLASYKDRAEHIMIVDLERNDLGRICEYGSVRPTEFITLEKYSTVYHLVSTVSGRLKSGIDAVEALRATFPGGSITGAPKIRSMEIIEELEPVKRNIYTGAIGYISFDGDMDTSIAIRTIVARRGNIYFHAGGGIVYDSDPQKEYLETLDKARGMMLAIGSRDHVRENMAGV